MSLGDKAQLSAAMLTFLRKALGHLIAAGAKQPLVPRDGAEGRLESGNIPSL